MREKVLDPRINLKNHPIDALTALLEPFGVSETLTRRLMVRVVYEREADLLGVRGLGRVVREALEPRVFIPRLALVEEEASPTDGFVRYLFRSDDGALFESVRIPVAPDRYSVCVSSQVGCALACRFCATGRMGYTRNLAPWEMVEQVMEVRSRSPHRVSGVVFMGQGEPFLNYEAVITAARILREPTGGRIRAENITLSTAGIVPAIKRFIEEKQPYRLIVSLNSARQETRAELMPIARAYPLEQLVEVMGAHARQQGTRVTVAWVALEGVNTTQRELDALAELSRALPIRFNLIDVYDPTGTYRRPEGEAWEAFVGAIRALEVPIHHRYSGGRDVGASCGLLTSRRRTDGLGVDDEPTPLPAREDTSP